MRSGQPDSLMLFAAGRGTRMAPITDWVPKPLVSVAGRPLIDHALDLVTEAGIEKVVVNIHHLGDQIANHLADRPEITLSDERDALLDTGGGLREALPLLGSGPVLTLNPDAIWTGTNPLVALMKAWNPLHMDALLMLIPRERASARIGPGDFSRDATGRLRRRGDLVYGGAQIIKTNGLAAIRARAFSLNLAWERMIASGRAFGLIHDGQWCDVGRPDCIPIAETLLA